jgi:pimeloyl-ACP methyl ester carboxylesterase
MPTNGATHLATAAPAGRFRFHPVEVNGIRGRVAGVGRLCPSPVVFVGSPHARIEAYHPTVAALALHGPTVAIELPGAGPTGRLRNPLTLDDYAGWLAGCLETLGLGEVTLIGHSHAGGVAVLTTAQSPARIGRLVLATSIGTGPFSLWRCAWGRLLDTITVEFGLALRSWHHLAYSAVTHPRNFLRQTKTSLDANLLAEARRVAVPVLVAWGARDATLPPWCAQRFADALSDASVYLSPGGSHCWPITHAAEFADAVAGWGGLPVS